MGGYGGPKTIEGTCDDDVLRFPDKTRDLVILGLGGDDLLEGGFGDDEVDGGEGDDTFVPGFGDDSFVGGAGFDTYDAGDLGEIDGELGEPFAFVLAFGGIVTKGTLGVDLIGTFDLAALDVEPIERVIAPLGIEGNLLDLSVQVEEQAPVASAIVNLEEEFITLYLGPIADDQELFTIEVVNFDDIVGTNFGGVLVGDEQANVIVGREGADRITGRLGADVLEGDQGGDRFVDTAAGLDGDTILTFAPGDVITVTDRAFATDALAYDPFEGVLTIWADDAPIEIFLPDAPDATLIAEPSTSDGGTDIRFEDVPVVHVEPDDLDAHGDGHWGAELADAGVEAGRYAVTVAWWPDHHGDRSGELWIDGETSAAWSFADDGQFDDESGLELLTLADPVDVTPSSSLALADSWHDVPADWLHAVTFTPFVGGADIA